MTVRELLKKIQAWRGLPGEDVVDLFERIAEQFRRDTGYLRPGKDCRLYSYEERGKVWDKWVTKMNDELDEEIATAVNTIHIYHEIDIEIARAAVDENPLPSWLQQAHKLKEIEKLLASDEEEAAVYAKISALF